MSFNHKDVIIFCSKIIATIINYVIVIGVIILLVVMGYQLITFVTNPYKGSDDPSKRKISPTTYLYDYKIVKPVTG